MKQFILSENKRYFELIHVLVERGLKKRYRGSILGIYWSLLNPLIMTGVYTAIFGTTFASYYNDSIFNYVLAAFTGLMVINFFSASTVQALTSIVDNSSLLNKIELPVSVFPLAAVVSNVLQFVWGIFPVLLILTILVSKSVINVLLLPIPFISLTLICAGFALIISTMYVFFRDLPYFYELVVFALWITSPVFYPIAIVPEGVRPFLSVNPLIPIIEGTRQLALYNTLPSWQLLVHGFLNGLIICVIGWKVFQYCRPRFMDLL